MSHASSNSGQTFTQSEGAPGGKNVVVEFRDGVAWVVLNRPDKRNAMSPSLNDEMVEILEALEFEDRCGVIVLTGAGESFCAGMDLKEFFRDLDKLPPRQAMAARRSAGNWTWRKLMNYPKPTIAMVNGWCFGGAFTPMISCDLAVAADDAQFGLSEINWGIFPAGLVSRAVDTLVAQRAALYYVMTGEPFTAQRATEIGLINESVPLDRLYERTDALARILLSKNASALRIAKMAYKSSRNLPFELAEDYMFTKKHQLAAEDAESGRAEGMKQFLDDKTYRPGTGSYRRES